jgi:hypothetical protein
MLGAAAAHSAFVHLRRGIVSGASGRTLSLHGEKLMKKLIAVLTLGCAVALAPLAASAHPRHYKHSHHHHHHHHHR